MLDKPFTIFLSAVVPSAALVCGVGLLLPVKVNGRTPSKSHVEWPATMPADAARSSTYAKLAKPAARIDPIGALIAPAPLEPSGPDRTASVPGQPETGTEPDQVVPLSVEDSSDLIIPTGKRNVALNSAPDAVSSRSEDSAPEKVATLDQADPPGGNLKPVSRPGKKPNPTTYGAGVYAALARQKPTAVERGRTTVTFDIGASGALGDVRVGQSSGSAQLDQIALQTVRNAAPFPPPPNGPSSYTIQIDFQ